MSIIIIVPSAIHGSLVPVFDYQGSNNTKLTAVLPHSVTRDPLDDYYSWYSLYETENVRSKLEVEITDETLHQHLWDRHQINTWVSENCTYPVLAQRRPATKSWRLVFVGGDEELQSFLDWFYNQKKGYVFEISDAKRAEVKAWISENIHGSVSFQNDIGNEMLNITFREANDATLFKLRWIG